jgi:transcriptional regulator with XRE-family HTH domain
MDNTVGEKIKKFRKRAGVSQFELELRINASPGSISRIESGQINPTKETLLKVVEALGLVSLEVASIFNIEPIKIENILKISKELYDSNNLDEILQKAVNDIVFELKLFSAFICIVKGEDLYAQTFTKSWYFDMAEKMLGKPYNQHFIPLDLVTDNLCVKSFKTKEIYFSDTLSDFVVPGASLTFSNALQRIVGWKCGISVPIVHNGKSIGVVCFGKAYIDDFKYEIPILKAFCEYIGESIYRINEGK